MRGGSLKARPEHDIFDVLRNRLHADINVDQQRSSVVRTQLFVGSKGESLETLFFYQIRSYKLRTGAISSINISCISVFVLQCMSLCVTVPQIDPPHTRTGWNWSLKPAPSAFSQTESTQTGFCRENMLECLSRETVQLGRALFPSCLFRSSSTKVMIPPSQS